MEKSKKKRNFKYGKRIKDWDLIKNSELSKGRKQMVFKLKRNGTYQARLVALLMLLNPGRMNTLLSTIEIIFWDIVVRSG
jgi:hypothetical protein